MWVELRTYDPEVYEEAKARVMAFQGYSSVRAPGNGAVCHVDVEMYRTMKAWPENPGTDHLFEVWAQAAGQYGFEVVRESRGGLSDGNYFWDVFPTLDGLGPAGANSHCSERSADGSKEQEYAILSSFVPKCVVNCLAVLKLVKMPE
jgi:glutamate carboxypeptidase